MIFKNNKVAVISDLHIGVHQDSPVWHDIILNYFKWFKEQLINKNIQDIVICGDINNNRNEISVNSLHVIYQVFNMLKEFNIKIIIGNHDLFYKNKNDINSLNLLKGWNNISIIDEYSIIDYKDKKISFCPWLTNVDQIQPSDILFGHCEINGFHMNHIKICTFGAQTEDYLKQSKLIISGHFHIRDERNYKDGTIIYTGSPYELDWGAINNTKGIYIVDLNDSTYEFIENNISPKHKQIKLSELIANNSLTPEFKKDIENNFVKFIVDKEIETEKLDKLTNILHTLKPLDLYIEFDNQETNLETNYEFTGIDIIGAIEEFIKMMDIQNKEDVLAYTLDLYKRSV